MKAVKDNSTKELFKNPVDYLRVDHAATNRYLDKCAKEFNAKLKIEDPKNYNKRRVKPCYLETSSHILSFFNGHLDVLRKHRKDFNEFTLSNPKLARKMRSGASKATAWRHIKFLMTTPFINGKPFITAKPFHGSHHDFGMMLNEDALIADHNNKYSAELLEHLSVINKGCELPVETVDETLDTRPKFSGFFTHQWLQNATHSRARTLIENCNLDKVAIVNNSEFASANSERDNSEVLPSAAASGFELEHASRAKVVPPAEGTPPPVAPPPPEKNQLSLNEHEQLMELHVRTCLQTMMSVLYPEYMMWKEEAKLVNGYLRNYFGAWNTPNSCKTWKGFADRTTNFTRRVVLTQSFVSKAPHRYVPSPAKWLNPVNPHGFPGTKKWLEQWNDTGTDKQREHNKNKNLLVELMHKYNRQPDTFTFNNAMKLLERKKDKRLAEMFSRFVINRKETYTHEAFAYIRKREEA